MGIASETLHRFSEHCSPEDCIVEMLDHWLRNHIGNPTWREVARSLEKIELHTLAVEIEKVYSTGIFI